MHAINPEPAILYCPKCRAQHVDEGRWADTPHRTHRCMFCEHEWRPFQYTTVGVPHPDGERGFVIVRHATFKRMYDYSCSIPTGPREGFYWRRRWPYQCEDREAHRRGRLDLAVTVPDPDPKMIGIQWRRLYVAEWLAEDALSEVLGAC